MLIFFCSAPLYYLFAGNIPIIGNPLVDYKGFKIGFGLDYRLGARVNYW